MQPYCIDWSNLVTRGQIFQIQRKIKLLKPPIKTQNSLFRVLFSTVVKVFTQNVKFDTRHLTNSSFYNLEYQIAYPSFSHIIKVNAKTSVVDDIVILEVGL